MPNLSKMVALHSKHFLPQVKGNKGSCWGSLKSVLGEHKKAPGKAPVWILTKTQPVSGKLPFVIIRKLRWVYVHIVVSIDLLNNLPLYFIHGLLVGEKGKDVFPFNDHRVHHYSARGREEMNSYLEVFVGKNHHNNAHHASRNHKTDQQRREQGVGMDFLWNERGAWNHNLSRTGSSPPPSTPNCPPPTSQPATPFKAVHIPVACLDYHLTPVTQGNLLKIILNQILWKRAWDSYGTKIILCRWPMKGNIWMNLALQPNSLLQQLLRNGLYGWFLFSSLCFLVFSKFSTPKKTLATCSFYCPVWRKKNLCCGTM